MNKICYVTTTPSTIKAFLLDVANYLHENGGYDITFVCAEDLDFKKSLPPHIHYIPVSMKRGIHLSGIKATFTLYKIFARNKYDIIQYSTPNASFYASIAAKVARAPVRLYCQWGIAYVGFKGLKRKVFKGFEKITCTMSTWIEPDSKSNLAFAINEGLYNQNKSSVVWNGSANGVNLEKFRIQSKEKWSKEIRSKYQIRKDTLVVGFVGRINRDKGVNELLATAKKLIQEGENILFFFVGPDDNCPYINKDLYEWSKSSRQIVYAGHIEETEKYYAAMDIFVLPSYREGFGTTIIEAQALGIPVIVTKIPGPIDAIIEGRTGIYVEKGNAPSLEGAIKWLLENSSLRKSYGEEGRKFVEKNFDSTRLKEELLIDRNRLLVEKCSQLN
jgi:glycosyltransferase involved in cell wall biosynthesis